jgi:glycosyltransferase involved in cell wall biosynthesis
VLRYRIDIIHSNTSAILGGAFVARICRLPHVWHVHEILVQPPWFGKLIYWIILKYSSKVICVSQAVANILTQGKGHSKVEVISNGIDVMRFWQQVNSQRLIEELEIKRDGVVIGQIGRITHWKGQELLLKSIAIALKKNPNLTLVFLGSSIPGDDSYMAILRDKIIQLGLSDKVLFLPFTEKAQLILQSFDILVVPSLQPEPFGLVILEGMLSGLPVIASAHGGPLEIIIEGKTGLFFPPGDEVALANAIIKLASDPVFRRKMGEEGFRRVSHEFLLDDFILQFERLYSDLLNSSYHFTEYTS